jgi:Leucine-rich repeat (LRR) protein
MNDRTTTRGLSRLLVAGLIFFMPFLSHGQDRADDAALQQQVLQSIRNKQQILLRQEARLRRALVAADLDGDDPDAEVNHAAERAADHSRVVALTFDSLVFRHRGENPSEMRNWLDSQLRSKIAVVDRTMHLTDAQREKLQLAGRGDIKHFIDRIEQDRRQFESVTDDALTEDLLAILTRTTRRLKEKLDSGLFDDGSLFTMTLNRSLTSEQAEISAAMHAIAAAGGYISPGKSDEEEVDQVILSSTDFGDKGLMQIRPLRHVKVLDLEATEITDDGLKHLTGLDRLEVLDLSNTGITDTGLAHLTRLNNLKVIYLKNAHVTDAGLEHLQGLKNLEVVDLARTQVTGGGIARLSALHHLKHLDLSGLQVTDADLESLRSLTSLERLYLDDTKVTDTGLLHLYGLTRLKRLDLFGAEVTETGLAELQQALPDVKVLQ